MEGRQRLGSESGSIKGADNACWAPVAGCPSQAGLRLEKKPETRGSHHGHRKKAVFPYGGEQGDVYTVSGLECSSQEGMGAAVGHAGGGYRPGCKGQTGELLNVLQPGDASQK